MASGKTGKAFHWVCCHLLTTPLESPSKGSIPAPYPLTLFFLHAAPLSKRGSTGHTFCTSCFVQKSHVKKKACCLSLMGREMEAVAGSRSLSAVLGSTRWGETLLFKCGSGPTMNKTGAGVKHWSLSQALTPKQSIMRGQKPCSAILSMQSLYMWLERVGLYWSWGITDH